jgi:multidrug efflux system membrane fusion protein
MRLWSVFGLFITVLSTFLMSCSDKKNENSDLLRPVRYQQVMLSGGERSKMFSGISQAGTEAELSFQVSGSLNSIHVKVGDRLNKGDLIATVDDSDALLGYEKSLVSLEKSRVQMETSKSTLSRVKELYENNNVSLQDYESAKTNYAISKAAYEVDKTNVELQKRKLDYYKLHAPISGIVTAVNVERNENIRTGQIIVELNARNDIEVNVGVPESYISMIIPGSNVSVKFNSNPGKVFKGVISEVAYNISSLTSTFPVIVKLLTPANSIRPGMSADVIFKFGKIDEDVPQKIIAPVASVGKDTNGNFVFVIIKDSQTTYHVEKKIVEIGELFPEGFEIISGIGPNDLVATAGLNSLMDGMKVSLLKE